MTARTGVSTLRKTPEVRGEGLVLGPWRAADAARVLEIATDPATRAWSPSMRPLNTEADALTWMSERTANADRLDWAVRDSASGLLIGRVGLHRFDPGCRSAEIGYGVHPAHRRRGVALRAVTAATTYAFTTLNLARISLVHATGNSASCAVASAGGFAFEGVERSSLDHGDGVRHDMHRHARLATDAGARPEDRADPGRDRCGRPGAATVGGGGRRAAARGGRRPADRPLEPPPATARHRCGPRMAGLPGDGVGGR